VIERTTLLLKLESVVKIDDVTGLPNERAWEEEVPREVSQARRSESPLTVVILDVGDFELGPEGEVSRDDRRLLRQTADALRAEVGPSDFLAHRRPGRFAALFPNLSPEDGEAAALRMRERVPEGREATVAVATWNGLELPAQLVGRAENQVELDRAASRRD
jgi:GGDEF domain-containing protein